MDFTLSVLTRRGGRSKNEDRADHTRTDSSALFILADGMGGHPDGEVAAEIAVRTAIELFHKEARSSTLADPSLFLSSALRTAHHRIIRYGTEQGLIDVPRTTAVACVVQQNKLWWANCGDSRLYLVRNGVIKLCTKDHSYVNRAGHSADAKRDAVSRNMLYTCLGSLSLPVIDVMGPYDLRPGDRVIECSDGLWGAVDDAKIALTLGQSPNITAAISLLVESALVTAGKGSDNVTVIGMEWMPNVSQEPQAQSASGASHTNLHAIFADNSPLDTEIDASINEINETLQRLADK